MVSTFSSLSFNNKDWGWSTSPQASVRGEDLAELELLYCGFEDKGSLERSPISPMPLRYFFYYENLKCTHCRSELWGILASRTKSHVLRP